MSSLLPGQRRRAARQRTQISNDGCTVFGFLQTSKSHGRTFEISFWFVQETIERCVIPGLAFRKLFHGARITKTIYRTKRTIDHVIKNREIGRASCRERV